MNAPAMESFSREEIDLQIAEECRPVITAAFAHIRGRVDIRHLWTRGAVTHLRVNWWFKDAVTGEEHIGGSAFVTVRRTDAGLEIDSQTVRHAA